MEEEKKKRWRPSLTAYREQEDVISRQCRELNEWRDKYRALDKQAKMLSSQMAAGEMVAKSEYDDVADRLCIAEDKLSLLDEADRVVSSELADLRAKNELLEKSNSMMEDGQKQQVAEISRLSEALKEANSECDYLRNRGFWARVFNY